MGRWTLIPPNGHQFCIKSLATKANTNRIFVFHFDKNITMAQVRIWLLISEF